jgi:hypothetical protein
MTSLLVYFVAGAALVGCTAGTPQVWSDRQVTFADYRTYDIQPVFNATGKSFTMDVPALLTDHIKAEFAGAHLPPAKGSQGSEGVLTVRTELAAFEVCEPYSAVKAVIPALRGTSRCTLRTRLIDKQSGRVVAEISTTKVAGGCTLYPFKTSEQLLQDVAGDIAGEVARLTSSSPSQQLDTRDVPSTD